MPASSRPSGTTAAEPSSSPPPPAQLAVLTRDGGVTQLVIGSTDPIVVQGTLAATHERPVSCTPSPDARAHADGESSGEPRARADDDGTDVPVGFLGTRDEDTPTLALRVSSTVPTLRLRAWSRAAVALVVHPHGPDGDERCVVAERGRTARIDLAPANAGTYDVFVGDPGRGATAPFALQVSTTSGEMSSPAPPEIPERAPGEVYARWQLAAASSDDEECSVATLAIDTTPPRLVRARELACGSCSARADLSLHCIHTGESEFGVRAWGRGRYAIDFTHRVDGACTSHGELTTCPPEHARSGGFRLPAGVRVVADPVGAM
jgi:hypothetical protein